MAKGRSPERRHGLAAAALAAFLLPTAALAAPADFRIRRKALDEALLDFAVQADVSLNAAAARQCRRDGNAVQGRMEPEEALRRLLAGTGCRFERVGPRAFRIVRAERVEPRPATPPPPPPQPEQPTVVEEVIVTATRRPMVASRLPYAVSAVSEERLDREGVADVGGVAELTPGLTVTNLGPGRDKLIIRGVSDGALTGRVQSTVGIYLDDTRLTYNAPDPDLRLADVERVEVLRGPQGSLYGAGSIGGVYHIVTRKPRFEETEARLVAETSLTADGEAGWALEAVYNMPVAGDRAALRVVGWDERLGGYIDNPALGLEDVNRTSRRGLRAALAVQAAPQWTLTAGAVLQAINSDDAQYTDGTGDLARSNAVREPHHNDLGGGWAALAGTTSWARVRWTGAWLRHEVDSRYDASEALPLFGGPAGSAAAFDEDILSETFVTELHLISPLGARIPWLVGGFYAEAHEDVGADLRAPASLYREDRSSEVSEFALYGEVSATRGRWTGVVGGRLFWSRDETRSLRSASGQVSEFEGLLEETGFAPKLVVRYQGGPRWMVYAQAAEGYRTGGFNTGGPAGQVFGGEGDAQPLRRYRGDELWSYELGGKWSDPDRGLALQAALYRVAWRDIQSTQLLPSGLAYTANLGDGEAFGLELEGAWSTGPLSFNANLILNEPELVKVDRGFAGASDSGLAGVPRFAASLSGHYERPLSGRWVLEADARLSWIGPSQLTFDAGLSPGMGDYGALRLAMGVRSERWRATAFVDNAADSLGDTFAYGNPFSVRSGPQHTPQRPATVGLRLERTF